MTGAGGPSTSDRFGAAKAVADSVLYEGYVLYPYRASARKNKFRWQFGLLYPPGTGERTSARAECLLEPAGPHPAVYVRARWLHAVRRDVEAAEREGWRPVEEAVVDGELLVGWDEGEEEVLDLGPLSVGGEPCSSQALLSLPGKQDVERSGRARVRTVRRSEPLALAARASAEPAGRYYKVSAELANTKVSSGLRGSAHNELARHCLIGAHIMLAAEGGTFVSVTCPPPEAASAAANCQSDGLYPVLVGEGDVVLASPIILYDFPAVAPETPGDFYDATEIDEILGLRVLTLTEEEKAEARATDPRAAAVIERCDTMGPAAWERLHGTMRPVQQLFASGAASARDGVGSGGAGLPWWSPEADASVDPGKDAVKIAGVEVRRGSKVKLVPRGGADAQDMFLAGRSATVEGVFTDVDGGVHLAVGLDEQLVEGGLGWQGRHLYFGPDEVEPLAEGGQ